MPFKEHVRIMRKVSFLKFMEKKQKKAVKWTGLYLSKEQWLKT